MYPMRLARLCLRAGVLAAALIQPGLRPDVTHAQPPIVSFAAPLGRPAVPPVLDGCAAPVPEQTGPLYRSPQRDVPLEVDFHLTDISAQAGVQDPNSVTRATSVADFDQDGWDDILVANSTGGIRLWRNNHDNTFTDMAEQVRIQSPPGSYPWGAVWADLDEDGDPDLYISNGGWYGDVRNVLYRNDYNRPCQCFTDVTAITNTGGTGEKSWGAAFADYNGDGYLDLYVQHTQRSGQLFRNRGGAEKGIFDDVTVEAGMYDDPPPGIGPGKAPIWLDYDLDGWPDLLAVRWQTPPILFHNKGDGTFEQVPRAGGLIAPGVRQWEPTLHDFNFDGLPDVWLPSYFESSALFQNTGLGDFTNIAASAGVSVSIPTMGLTSEDFNNDGLPELLQGEGSPPRTGPKFLWLNTSNRQSNRVSFVDASVEVGMLAVPDYRMHGGASLDFDKDGDLDAITGNGGADTLGWAAFEPKQLWRNDGGNTAGGWLNLNLRGTISNVDGIGARVRADALGYSTYQWQLADVGFSSQNSHWLHIGLAAVQQVDITIEWPSGVVQTMTDVSGGQWLDVVEPPIGDQPILQGVSVDRWQAGLRIVTIAGRNLGMDSSIRVGNVGAPGSPRVAVGTLRLSDLPGATVNADGSRISFQLSLAAGRYEFVIVHPDGRESGRRYLVLR